MESSTEILDTPRKSPRTEGWHKLCGPRQEILYTLEDFKKEEFESFQWYLSRNVMSEFEAIPKSHLEKKRRDETVDVMVEFHTEDRAVKVAVEILKKLGQHDIGKLLVEKYTGRNRVDVQCISITDLLLCTLEELGVEDFERFRQQLSQKLVIVFEAIPRGLLENKTREQTVDLMMGAHTEDGALSVAVEILKLMSQHNAAKKLVEWSEIYILENRIFTRQEKIKKLIEALDALKKEQFQIFQRQLSQPLKIGFEVIPASLLENKSRKETVDLMVAFHTEDGAVTVAVEILKRIGRRNSAMKLLKECRAACQVDSTVSLTFIPRW